MSPLFAVLLYVGVAAASPVVYDQRQEGEVNVHAHLEDILVVFVPKSDPFASVPSLVNIFRSKYPDGMATPPPEFESPEGNKTAAVQAALEAAKPEVAEIEQSIKTESQTIEIVTTTDNPDPPTTTDKPE